MRIQHNIMAMNSYRNYSNNTSALSKNLEKLSSGYKVNRAGDDAAGLAVSEKMRSQITGLEAAQKNVKDATNLVKTAEGAMQEIQDMIKRMKYLATESANGTFDNETDRSNLQKEVEALKTEIDRIADSSNFNGIKLLDGSLEAPSGAILVKTGYSEGAMTKVTATTGSTFSQTITIASGTSATTGGTEGAAGTMDLSYLDKDGISRSTTISFTYGSSTNETATNISNALKNVFGTGYNVTVSNATITIANANGNEKDLTQILAVKQYNEQGNLLDDVSASNKATTALVSDGKDDKFALGISACTSDSLKNFIEIDGTRYQILEKGGQVQEGYKGIYVDDLTGNAPTKETAQQIADQLNAYGVKAEVDTSNGIDVKLIKSNGNDGKGGLTLQIGDTADSFNQMKVAVGDMHVSALGLEGIDISTQSGAAAAIDAITKATNIVSSVRGDLGAVQNRLDHTLNNLSVMTENIQDAESTIRDTDVAEEMMAYTKNNILIQSAQAMLAQANAVPQGVLQLLG